MDQKKASPKPDAEERAAVDRLRAQLQKGLDSGLSERTPAQIHAEYRKRRAAA
jgi:hypothetical protein